MALKDHVARAEKLFARLKGDAQSSEDAVDAQILARRKAVFNAAVEADRNFDLREAQGTPPASRAEFVGRAVLGVLHDV